MMRKKTLIIYKDAEGTSRARKAKRTGTWITEEEEEAKQNDKKEEVGSVFIGKSRRARMTVEG